MSDDRKIARGSVKWGWRVASHLAERTSWSKPHPPEIEAALAACCTCVFWRTLKTVVQRKVVVEIDELNVVPTTGGLVDDEENAWMLRGRDGS